jgi:hypothetical protein
VEVVELQSSTPARLFSGVQPLQSTVLPDCAMPVDQIFL